MAIDFSGADLLTVIAALGAAGATVVGAYLANRRVLQQVKAGVQDTSEDEIVGSLAHAHHRLDDLKIELDDLARFTERTFVPRQEFTAAVNQVLTRIEAVRSEQTEARHDIRDVLRRDIRDLRARVDLLIERLMPAPAAGAGVPPAGRGG